MRAYTLQDRSYPAQIFNRVIHRNHNSHRTTTGRYLIQTMYANGLQPQTYAGRFNVLYHNATSDSEWYGNNAIGVEVLTRGHNAGQIALRVYADGLGIYIPYLFYVLPRYMRRDIDEMVRDAFDFIKTVTNDDYGTNEIHHIKRKPICQEFREEYINVDDFGTFLETKYNIPRGEHARENV